VADEAELAHCSCSVAFGSGLIEILIRGQRLCPGSATLTLSRTRIRLRSPIWPSVFTVPYRLDQRRLLRPCPPLA